jgi:crotonobetainyl-CoA:carnitine CoA-transferase CaiB-like acyl-CoA transferase
VRVVDVGTRIAAPFCAGILAELGAEVVKVEQPGTGDLMRSLGPFQGEHSLFWSVEDRSRRGVTCDLRKPRGQELARRLLSRADVVCENFRPGTMEQWGLGPADLPPSLIYVRISLFGQTGPASGRPGLDITALAASGLLHLTGYPDGPPMKSGVTIADHLTGAFAAQAAIAGLVARNRTGRGMVIDAPLHASVLRCLEWTLPAVELLALDRGRRGTRGVHDPPSGVYEAADGKHVALVVRDDHELDSLARALDEPGLGEDRRLSGRAGRIANVARAESTVASAIKRFPSAEMVRRLRAQGLACSAVRTAADIVGDPDAAEAGDVVGVDDPHLGAVRQQGAMPRWEATRPAAPRPAPGLGEHNREVWCDEVGLSSGELEDLVRLGIV